MTPSVADIQRAVCDTFGITMLDMVSDRRGHAVAHPRQVAMYLARHLTQLSLPAIGHHFGNRDHTTVMYACRVVEERIAKDRQLADVVGVIRHNFTAGPDGNQMTMPLTRR